MLKDKSSALSAKIMVTVFRDLSAKKKHEHQWSMKDLLDEIERTEANDKKELPLLKLATFGNDTTEKGSYRHDSNMVTVSGIEGDYDLEEITPEDAAAIFKKARIACVIYTSASHTPKKPRWRVLAPFSDELLPRQRSKMLARMNGLISGTFSRESFANSQSFYFGDVVGKHPTEMIEVEGDYIDQRPDLDEDAILPEDAKREVEDHGDRESTPIDEAQELYDRDLESGKLQGALEAALEYRWELGDKVGSDEDRELWWRNICWAIHHGSGGDKSGYAVWQDYASRSYRASRLKKRGDSVKHAIITEWRQAKDNRSGGVLGFGTVYKQLEINAGWVHGQITIDDFDDDEDGPEDRPTPKTEVAKEERQSGIPADILTIPGVLGLAVDHYNVTSTRYQPQYAVQTALALGSVILGRNWVSETDNFTSLYLVNLGATGRGKEFGRTFLERVLEDANLGHLVGPMKYASEAAVMGELSWKPRHVTIYDEFGRLLSSTGSSGNTNLRDAQTLLMSLFGQLGGVARPTAYSTNGKTAQQVEAMRNQRVVRPAVTLLGLSTPETFFDALSQDDVANGFLNRLLVVNSRQPRRVEKPKAWRKVPRELVSWMTSFGDQNDDFLAGESPTEVGDPEIVQYTSGGLRRLDEIEQEVIDLQDEYEAARLDGMFSRSREIAMRIALIVTLSRSKQKIDETSLNWAWDYVLHYTMEMVENTRRMMGASPAVRIAEHIAQAIVKVGRKGMSLREISRLSVEFSRLDKRGQDEVMHRLTGQHEIIAAKPKSEKGGRPTLRYIHSSFI